MPAPAQSWLLRDERRVSTTPGRDDCAYHRGYVGVRHPVLRGVIALMLLVVGFVGLAAAFQYVSQMIDTMVFDREGPSTPLRQAAGALGLAALIPYSMVIQRLVYGVSAGYLHSVAGRFRFEVFGRALVAFGPPVVLGVAVLATRNGDAVGWTAVDLIAYMVIGLLLTPLGAAGEEYGFRGLMFRVLGSWAPSARSGAVVGVVVTTVLFSLIHGTLDPFLFTSYLVLFGSAAIVTWRTGGLEVAVVIHGVYNVAALLLATALHVDVGGELAERGAAAGSWVNLVPSGVLVLVTAVVWSTTRGRGPITRDLGVRS